MKSWPYLVGATFYNHGIKLSVENFAICSMGQNK